MKPIRTWVLIADGARARIVETEGRGKPYSAVEGMVFEGEHAATRDLISDKPGRTFDSAGHHRHAMEPTSDPHREAKRSFAGQLADVLAAATQRGAFDRLVIVAPAKTMGDLRSALASPTRQLVSGELVSDLTKVPNDDLASHLDNLI